MAERRDPEPGEFWTTPNGGVWMRTEDGKRQLLLRGSKGVWRQRPGFEYEPSRGCTIITEDHELYDQCCAHLARLALGGEG